MSKTEKKKKGGGQKRKSKLKAVEDFTKNDEKEPGES